MKWKKHKSGTPKPGEVTTGQYQLSGYNGKPYRNAVKNTVTNIFGEKRQQAKTNVSEDNNRGKKLTKYYSKNLEQIRKSDAKRKIAPNMYTTRNKGHYEKSATNHTITITSGGSTKVINKYGQNQKKADMKADKKMRRDFINKQNPHSYDKSKSLKKNIEANKRVSKKRKALKAKAYKRVDESYRGV